MDNRNIKKYLKDLFSFTRGERNGIIVLLFCILVTTVFRITYPIQKKNGNTVPDNKYLVEKAQLENQTSKKDTLVKTGKYIFSEKSSWHKNTDIPKPKSYKIIELNSTDTLELDGLPGIGPAYARRIIKYRNLLGGYYNKEQILEVYGMKPENYWLFEKYIRVDTTLITRVFLNSGTFKEINAHPYVSFDQTKAIFGYRNKGQQITMELLRKNNLFDSIEIKKLKPYIKF